MNLKANQVETITHEIHGTTMPQKTQSGNHSTKVNASGARSYPFR